MIEVPLGVAVRLQATLAKPVYGQAGQVMVQKDRVVTAMYAERLQQMGISSVYINGGKAEDGERVVCEIVRQRAAKVINTLTFNQKTEIKEIIEKILSDILYYKGTLDNVSNISTHDGYTFTHSVDVCILALSIGYQMGFTKSSLLEIGTGALLHDVGKLSVPSILINKVERFSDEEFELMQNHTVAGYNLIKSHPQVSERAAQMVLQHHERYDGSGYPHKKSGRDIHSFSSICAVADVYSAMITNRCYRNAHPPHEVYEYVLGLGNAKFDFKVVQAFAMCVSPYPKGMAVYVSDGRIAWVTGNKTEHPYLPNVIYADDDQNRQVNLHKEGKTVRGTVPYDKIEKLEQEVGRQGFTCILGGVN